jgi:hypothetical protein
MREGPDLASLAASIEDPALANMLIALMSGMTLAAGAAYAIEFDGSSPAIKRRLIGLSSEKSGIKQLSFPGHLQPRGAKAHSLEEEGEATGWVRVYSALC